MSSRRVQNAEAIAETIVENIPLNQNMHLLDMGAGTGLLSFFVAQKVGKITALDTSASMLAMFTEKKDEFACETDFTEGDIMEKTFDISFDGIISSMTIHHIEHTKALFEKLYTMLKPGGFIALADLESEDGTFHSDNEGVFHHGFDTTALCTLAKETGFENVHMQQASIIEKPHRNFGIFLLTATKP